MFVEYVGQMDRIDEWSMCDSESKYHTCPKRLQTEYCLRLREFTCSGHEDYTWWMEHDLCRGHLGDDQKPYFDNEAVWLCARCEDVGGRNGIVRNLDDGP